MKLELKLLNYLLLINNKSSLNFFKTGIILYSILKSKKLILLYLKLKHLNIQELLKNIKLKLLFILSLSKKYGKFVDIDLSTGLVKF